MSAALFVLSVLFGLLPRVGATPTASAQGAPESLRVLFIGNSYTASNEGVHNVVRELGGSATPPRTIETAAVLIGGASLATHWSDGTARARIREGGWDFVVLQCLWWADAGQTELTIYQYARLFDAEIKQAGAQTVFYETWVWGGGSRPTDTDWPYDLHDQVVQAYHAIAAELEAVVAHVGEAWWRSFEQRPALDLYDADNSHPSPAGTYLAACTFYAALTGENPMGLAYVSMGVTTEDAALLQQVAWETTSGVTLPPPPPPPVPPPVQSPEPPVPPGDQPSGRCGSLGLDLLLPLAVLRLARLDRRGRRR
ncbi:MAG: hypothetical protein HYY16_19655 [Planctomycetes bacterium]|nr:hypothetical protein [Planctomycetota bacterium]